MRRDPLGHVRPHAPHARGREKGDVGRGVVLQWKMQNISNALARACRRVEAPSAATTASDLDYGSLARGSYTKTKPMRQSQQPPTTARALPRQRPDQRRPLKAASEAGRTHMATQRCRCRSKARGWCGEPPASRAEREATGASAKHPLLAPHKGHAAGTTGLS